MKIILLYHKNNYIGCLSWLLLDDVKLEYQNFFCSIIFLRPIKLFSNLFITKFLQNQIFLPFIFTFISITMSYQIQETEFNKNNRSHNLDL